VGGRVAPTLVDIASIDVLFSFKEIYVVHHTGEKQAIHPS
jgi:hypothetical protein